MKILTKMSLAVLVTLGMFSCSEDDVAKNLAPSSPITSFPADAAKNVDLSAVLKWNASIDPEKSAVKYDIYVSNNEKLTNEDIKSKDQLELEFKPELAGHTTYFWKVVAKDNSDGKAESKIFSFSTSNSLPSAVSKLVPTNEAKNVAKIVDFKWEVSTDADKDIVKYNLYVSKKKDFTDADIKAKDLEVNNFELSLDGHTQYFWQVETKDSEGGSIKSELFSFTTLNTNPVKAIPTAPSNEAVDLDSTLDFVWTAATDADSDALTYVILVSEKEDFSDIAYTSEELNKAELKAVALKGSTKYYWKIVSSDALEASTESDVFSFTTKSSEIVVNTVEVDGLVKSLNWDACKGDAVKYTVYLSKNDEFTAADIVVNNIDETTYKFISLDGNTTYYCKVVASGGATIAGVTKAFTVAGKFGFFCDVRDNHEYKTVNIDGKIWLAENFAFIPAEDTKPKVTVPGDDTKDLAYAEIKEHANYKKYGLLYSLNAINKEGVVPTGWHLATHKNWCDVEKSIGMTDEEIKLENDYRGTVEEKLQSVTGWATNGTNESGLNLFPAGCVAVHPMFGAKMKSFGDKCLFWTGTLINTDSTYGTYYRAIYDGNPGIKSAIESTTNRYSVRLVRD